MPYIKNERAVALDMDPFPETAGELNYVFLKSCLRYMNYMQDSAPMEKVRMGYNLFNDIVGALECCKLEIYRRLVSPYEDGKCKENGDKFPK